MSYQYKDGMEEMLSNGKTLGGELLDRFEDANGLIRGLIIHQHPDDLEIYANMISEWTKGNSDEEDKDFIDIWVWLLLHHEYDGEIDKDTQDFIKDLHAHHKNEGGEQE